MRGAGCSRYFLLQPCASVISHGKWVLGMSIARIMRKLGDLSALAREKQGSDVPPDLSLVLECCDSFSLQRLYEGSRMLPLLFAAVDTQSGAMGWYPLPFQG